MKTLTRLFILLFVMAGVSSCYTGIPLKQGKSENNRTYEVSYLFEHDGVKVYRFMDMVVEELPCQKEFMCTLQQKEM